MNAETIIREVQADSVSIAASRTGTIRARGDSVAVNRWLATIRDHKSEILRALEQRGRPMEAVSRWWVLHYRDSDPTEVSCYPAATHAEMLEAHPDALAAEPFTPTIRQASAPLTANEEAALRAWLSLIQETDTATVAAVIDQCRRDADARVYFIRQAHAALPKPPRAANDLRRCTDCRNLLGRRCQAARRGEMAASRDYEPVPNLPRRCECYTPGDSDPDKRPGALRWPGLTRLGSY